MPNNGKFRRLTVARCRNMIRELLGMEEVLLPAMARRYATWRSVPAGFRLEGNLDLDVTAIRRRSNGSGNTIGMLPNERPLDATRQHHESDAACRQVLLVADATVCREQQIEPRFLGRVQEIAIAERVPSPGLRRVDGVPGQSMSQSLRRPVVKEDEHRWGPGPREGSQPQNPVRPSPARASRRTVR